MRHSKIQLACLLLISAFIVLFIGCAFNKHLKLTPSEMYRLAENRMKEKKYIKAREIFTNLRDDYPETSEAHLAQLRIADSLFETKAFDLAAVEYQVFTDLHPASKWAPYALYRLGFSKYKDIGSIDRDQQVTKEAVEVFRKLLSLYPDAEEAADAQKKLKELERRIIEHHIYVGEFYMKLREWRAASGRFEEVIQTGVEEDQVTRAMLDDARCNFMMRKYDQSKTLYSQVLDRSLTEPEAELAKEMIATIAALPPSPTPTVTPTPQGTTTSSTTENP